MLIKRANIEQKNLLSMQTDVPTILSKFQLLNSRTVVMEYLRKKGRLIKGLDDRYYVAAEDLQQTMKEFRKTSRFGKKYTRLRKSEILKSVGITQENRLAYYRLMMIQLSMPNLVSYIKYIQAELEKNGLEDMKNNLAVFCKPLCSHRGKYFKNAIREIVEKIRLERRRAHLLKEYNITNQTVSQDMWKRLGIQDPQLAIEKINYVAILLLAYSIDPKSLPRFLTYAQYPLTAITKRRIENQIRRSPGAKEALLSKAGITRATVEYGSYGEIFRLNYDTLMKRITAIRQRLRKKGFDTMNTSLRHFAAQIAAGNINGRVIDEIISRMLRERTAAK